MKKIIIHTVLFFSYVMFSPSVILAGPGRPIFGEVQPPFQSAPGSQPYASDVTGLISFFTNILRLIFLIAGLFSLIKIVIAGFGFISAGGEPKKIEQAWANIWQSVIGLLIIVSSFVITAIIGKIFFGNSTYILQPILYGVGN